MSQPSFFDSLNDALHDLIRDHGYDHVARTLARMAPVNPVPSAPARASDPETSHLASKQEPDLSRFSARSRQARLLAVFERRPLTDQQATVAILGTHAAPSAFDGCRRRCSDLRAVNYLFDTDVRRMNPGSADLSVVWGITDEGRAALHRLDVSGWSR